MSGRSCGLSEENPIWRRMSTRFPLSPIDHVFTGDGAYPIQLLFAYDGVIDPARLEVALIKTLRQFPPVTSTLVMGSSGRYELESQDGAYSFKTSELDLPLNVDSPAAVARLFEVVDTHPGEILTKITLWRSGEKSYLAVGISHCIGDGFSFFYFMTAWAATFHGRSVPPVDFDRTALIPKTSPGSVDARNLLENTGLTWAEARLSLFEQKLHWLPHPYSREKIKALREEVRSQTTSSLTDNDILVADMARSTLGEGEARRLVGCAIDCRRIHPGLSRNYFGNAVTFSHWETTAAALRAASLSDMALSIRESVSRIQVAESVASIAILERFLQVRGPAAFQQIHVADPLGGMLITNLSRVPLDAIDFGAGRPVALRSATPAPRVGMVLPAEDGLGIIYNYPVK